ncbi:lysophospholipid acyltransferase family protein [Jidongwangia harbinensis]|uniref:lysophospholipid acyltransferase family protein n=1 Tax=Jidongwangia harbinensis TaxID=2878561 RepID=UPI001CD966AC|nr:lysophospholipid acyltransferase family protein [Jidongwangia harbinensis]MCA2213509.1 1-acyl-sn-glycerol-3-phosphate acyltransferase [Jidongwangia harbinensis]
MPPLYTLSHRTVGSILRRCWRPAVHGLEHVPRTGAAILAGNHLSVADELFLAAVVPRHVAFWAKAEYFSGRGVRGRFTHALVTGLGAIKVERGGGRAALTAFDAAIPVLGGGGLIALYPEGTRSPDGRLYRGRTGMVRLAQRAEVPIIPVGVLGTDRVLPIDARVPRPGRVTVRFGEPVPVAGRIDGPADIRAVTDEVMARIRALTGQQYVPQYAPRRAPAPR